LANTAQARKRARQAEHHRAHNTTLRSRFKTTIKNVRAVIASGDKTAAQAAYNAAVSMIDKTETKGLIHKNLGARQKARLNAQLRKMA
jgi:small subunit ribosomal protein S20